MSGDNARIEDLAGAILDGAPIDWASAASSADVDAALLKELRVLAAIAAHRRKEISPAPDEAGYSPASASALQPPAIVDRKYMVEASLGHGGMGSVYRVRHTGLGKRFALKVLLPHRSCNAGALARFYREADALGRLNHPNIVQVTDFGVDTKVGPYLVMEFIEGISLAEHLKLQGALPPDEALPLFGKIARALDHAHASGILHRDLKPANVLLFKSPDGRCDGKIVDFGIASFLDDRTRPASIESDRPYAPGAGEAVAENGPAARDDEGGPESETPRLTAPGAIPGTSGYIAPEVAGGAIASSAADIFTFGVLVYEALVGRRPFSTVHGTHADAEAEVKLVRPSDLCATVPHELDQDILAPLCTDPLQRPARADYVVTGLSESFRRAHARQWRAAELPRRIFAAAAMGALAMGLHGALGAWPIVQTLELITVDRRAALLASRPPDPRVVLISIDEATLAADARPLAARADDVSARLEEVFAAGAKTVAIDLLLPEEWSRSARFSQLVLEHAPRLLFASYSAADGRVTGPESVQGPTTVALEPSSAEKLFAFVNVAPDSDGIVRTLPISFKDRDGRRVPSFAARLAEVVTGHDLAVEAAATTVWIDYSVEWTRLTRFSWSDLSNVLATRPRVFRDRLVLVGAEFAGSGDVYRANGYFRGRPSEMSGLELQAVAVNTLLHAERITKADGPAVRLSIGLAAAAAVLSLLLAARSGPALSAIAIGVVLYLGMSVLFFRSRLELLPMVAPVLSLCVATAGAFVIRQRLSPHPDRFVTSKS